MKNLSNTINLFLLIILSAVLTACGGGGSESTGSSDDANSRVVEELKVSPKNSQAPLYTNLDFQAQAIYSDGTSQNVTQSVVWESGDTSIATFDADAPGILRSKAEGTVTITAALGDKSAATTATVSSPELLSLRLSKSDWLLARGETDSVSANGNYRGDVTRDVTDEVSWASENEGIVTISNQESNAGMISSIAVGSTKITASLNGITADAAVTVGAAALTSIVVSIKDTSVFEGSTSQVSATATYTDGSSKEVTEQVVWLSSDPSAASVSSTGLVSAISTGSVTISAQLGELKANTILDVVISPNSLGALTLQAIPNVILDNGLDTSQIIATVLPNDEENGVIADGTEVRFAQSSNDLVINSSAGGTVGGQIIQEAVSFSSGQYDVIAEVPDTNAIDQATVQVVSSFSSVIGINGTWGSGVDGGLSSGPSGLIIFAGSSFSATVTNTSNRSFNIQSAILLNGSSVVGISTDPGILGGGTLEAGESVGIVFTLNQDYQSDGFSIVFDLSDEPTGTTFAVTWNSPL